ncbi:uncharacterized protein LOC109800452 isoform X2 [Cajanus cajan]|uniref:uncharacterized protein LOC109800452 isoform X2 n=1 Tax=Cajanus cajan TaxID=3821 RepID=UPI0010FB7511|nr:uncharacterized protein LOC109800452 isoform X2 [Cajanus cajan]
MESASRGIVQEVLTKDNYERWKILMRNYLRGKDLWAVVERGFNSTNANDSMKDAEALHIIQLSCGSKIFDEIKHFETAKDTWNSLASLYGSELKAEPDIEQGVVDDNVRCYRKLYRYVEKGNWKGADLFIRGEKGALLSASDSDKRTVLHVAAIAGHVNVVEGLVKEGGERLLKMQDSMGNTALALAAHLTGNTNVAKCMVEDNGGRIRHNLLSITNKDGEIPLLLAAHRGHKLMTRYLFLKTPKKVLNEQDYHNRVLLLERCIKGEIFDVALRLLESYLDLDQLPPESLTDCFRALHTLTKMPSAFLSGCQFGLRQKFIYYILRVGKKFQHNEGRRHKTNFPDIFLWRQFYFSYDWTLSMDISFNKDMNIDSLSCGGLTHSGEPKSYWCRFCRPVLNVLLLPVKLLSGLVLEIVYVFIQIFKFLHMFGIREIYEQKCTHIVVRQILWYMKRSVEKLNNSQLEKALVYDAMLHAAKHGIVEFIDAMTEANHDLLWAKDSHDRGIFSYAILHRKQKVFQLIYSLNGRKDIIKYRTDVFGNNLLHFAGHLGPSSDLNRRPGAALQMQREIQWFKAVEEVVHPKCKEARNDDDKKPHELFTEMHDELVKEGEKWAKQAAKSFALVGILITTVMFAAAFTVPDAISLFTSATSVLIFIWILTSRFAEKDFLKRIPFKLLAGLGFLFLSVASMMVAFCAALGVVLNHYWAYKRLFIGGAILGSIPVFVLVPSQLRLIYEIFRSTLWNPIRRIK